METRYGSPEIERLRCFGTMVCRAWAMALWKVAVLAAFLPLATPHSTTAAGRVALVVGNGAYTHAGRLPNPANDASDVAAALGRLGFEVTVTQDAGRTALNEALRAFTRRSVGADVALVFYAGHAMEMDGVNYLLPVDAIIERDTDVRYETVTLDDVLASTSGAGLRVVILDACRNNPLARSMQRTVPTRSVSNGSLGDLNEALLGDETLVAYSAAAGTTAADGEGRNSPYTAALLAHLEQPVELGLMFRRVREGVLTATSGRQRPHEYQSLLREHYLSVSGGGAPVTVTAGGSAVPGGVASARGPEAAGAAEVVAGGSSAVLAQQETVFWQSIVNSTNQADFEAYLARWPEGVYAPLARGRVVTLRPAADPPRPLVDGETLLRQAAESNALGVIGWLGVGWTWNDEEKTALIDTVSEDGPVDSAGVQVGDVIQAYNGMAFGNIEELAATVMITRPDALVSLEVVRDGRGLAFDVKIGQDDFSCWRAVVKHVSAPSSIEGRLDYRGDSDCFRIDVGVKGRLTVETDGGTDTMGHLVGNGLDVSADDEFWSYNFHMRKDVSPGSYFVEVSGFNGATGEYIFKVAFEPN